jgi:hypothetical protein
MSSVVCNQYAARVIAAHA